MDKVSDLVNVTVKVKSLVAMVNAQDLVLMSVESVTELVSNGIKKNAIVKETN